MSAHRPPMQEGRDRDERGTAASGAVCREAALQKVQRAEHAWNTRDPQRVALSETPSGGRLTATAFVADGAPGAAPWPEDSLSRAVHTHALCMHTQRRHVGRRPAAHRLEPAAQRPYLAVHTVHRACVRRIDKAPRKTPEKLASPTIARTRNRWSGRRAYAQRRAEPDELVAGVGFEPTTFGL